MLRRLDPDESIVVSVGQSGTKPRGAAVINPHAIFITGKRVIIRSPTRPVPGEDIEAYDCSVIKSIRIGKGLPSPPAVFVEGMPEISQDRKWNVRGRTAAGAIDAIPGAEAGDLHRYVWAKIREARGRGANVAPPRPSLPGGRARQGRPIQDTPPGR